MGNARQATAAGTFEDALLARPLQVDHRVDHGPFRVVGIGHHFIDLDGDRVWQLVAKPLQCLLADQFRNACLDPLVGNVADGIEPRALGQLANQHVEQHVRLHAAGRRHGHNLAVRAEQLVQL